MKRRLSLSPLQRWGVPLLALAPLLALLGPLAISSGSVAAANGSLELEVDYPSRARNGQATALTIAVRNPGATAVRGVEVALDRAYAEAFRPLASEPANSALSDDEYRVSVGDLAAGESRLLRLDLTPRRNWRVEGEVVVTTAGGPAPLGVEFATFVLP